MGLYSLPASRQTLKVLLDRIKACPLEFAFRLTQANADRRIVQLRSTDNLLAPFWTYAASDLEHSIFYTIEWIKRMKVANRLDVAKLQVKRGQEVVIGTSCRTTTELLVATRYRKKRCCTMALLSSTLHQS